VSGTAPDSLDWDVETDQTAGRLDLLKNRGLFLVSFRFPEERSLISEKKSRQDRTNPDLLASP
jgi:hypothetical protein